MRCTTGQSAALAITAAQLKPATPAPMIATGKRPSCDIESQHKVTTPVPRDVKI